MKEVKTEIGKRGVRCQEDGERMKLAGFLYDELSDDLRAMLGRLFRCVRKEV